MNRSRYWLVVPAAGIGQRMQADCPKQYLRLDGRYILDITLSRLLQHPCFSGCMVALHPEDSWWPGTLASTNPRIHTCTGGRERADSVLAALGALATRAAPDDWVLVHDVARPCLHPGDLDRLITRLSGHAVGGLLAAPVTDTLKRTRPGSLEVEATVDRSSLWRALTPQMFRYQILAEALVKALDAGVAVTDEASAVEHAGLIPELVEGRSDNLKITLPADLALAGFILGQIGGGPSVPNSENQ